MLLKYIMQKLINSLFLLNSLYSVECCTYYDSVYVHAAPVVTGTGPNFSLGELQGHLAYDLNPPGVGMRRTLPSTSSSGSVHTCTHTDTHMHAQPHVSASCMNPLVKALCP